jgi:phospholipase/carboxylesterase
MNLVHTAYVPEGDGPFPTIVAIHGFGANANDLLGLAPYLRGGEALMVCPQGALGVGMPDRPGLVIGWAWFQITGGRPPEAAEFERASRQLQAFVDEALERYPADRRKVLLLGFSQGGVMAYDLFLRHPERYAGLAALSSWLPTELAATAPAASDELKGRPVLVLHGSDDPMIPVERARESRDALLGTGVSLSYRELEMGHEISPDALRALIEWTEQKVFGLIQLA